MVCNGKQNNSVKFGVLGFFGCSGVPVFRRVPVFQRSSVPAFRCSGVPVFRCSGVPVFRCSGVPGFSTCHLKRFTVFS